MSKEVMLIAMKEIIRLGLLGSCVYVSTDYAFPKSHMDYIKSLSGGRFLYLTNLGLYLTIFTVVLGYIVRLGNITGLESSYKVFLSSSFSLEGVLTIMFWTLLRIDPVLIKNEESDDDSLRVSFLIDICQHLIPFILLS